jgi:hypothetical protein
LLSGGIHALGIFAGDIGGTGSDGGHGDKVTFESLLGGGHHIPLEGDGMGEVRLRRRN